MYSRSTLPTDLGEDGSKRRTTGATEINTIHQTHRHGGLRECQVPGRILVRLALLDAKQIQLSSDKIIVIIVVFY